MVTSFTVTGASRLLIAVVLVWLLIIFVITGPLFRWSSGRSRDDPSVSGDNNGEMILARLSRANSELNALKAQNEELRMLLQNYLPAEVKITHNNNNIVTIHEPSQEYEASRRRVASNIDELWHYLRTKTNTSFMSFVNEIRHNLMFDLDIISNRDNEWRHSQLKQLSDYVQKKIISLQNPEKGSCATTKKLVCQLNKGCGFGCQIHHLAYCMIVSMATQRTLIMNSRNWRYAHSKSKVENHVEGWNSVFSPLSNTCTDDSGSSRGSWGPEHQIESIQVIDLPIVDSLRPRPQYLPLAIPSQISSKLMTLHGSPIVWFIGQIVHYIMRPSEEMEKYINERKEKFKFDHPIVGIHVRRTDKIGTEAAFHPLSEYMNFVDDYYNKLDLYNERNKKPEKHKRLVYIATDDPSIWRKEVKPFEDRGYTFIGDSQIAKTASVGQRYSIDSLRNIILDIWLLSQCDFLICTFSSQVCRLAYELMQFRGSFPTTDQIDASSFFYSLDDIYYFGGQNDHNQISILSHKAKSDAEIDFKIGEIIGIAGNHWNGYSKGFNRVNRQNGLYPGFKTIEKIDTVPFKLFDD